MAEDPLHRIDDEISRLEQRLAEVEAMIKRDRTGTQQAQLQQHQANVERTLNALRQQRLRGLS